MLFSSNDIFFFLPNPYHFYFLFLYNCTKTSSTMLNRNSNRNHSCIILHLTRKVFKIFHIVYDICYIYFLNKKAAFDFLSKFWHQENHMIFSLFPVNVVNYIDQFLNAIALLHIWNKLYIVVLHYAFKIHDWIQLANILLRTLDLYPWNRLALNDFPFF